MVGLIQLPLDRGTHTPQKLLCFSLRYGMHSSSFVPKRCARNEVWCSYMAFFSFAIMYGLSSSQCRFNWPTGRACHDTPQSFQSIRLWMVSYHKYSHSGTASRKMIQIVTTITGIGTSIICHSRKLQESKTIEFQIHTYPDCRKDWIFQLLRFSIDAFATFIWPRFIHIPSTLKSIMMERSNAFLSFMSSSIREWDAAPLDECDQTSMFRPPPRNPCLQRDCYSIAPKELSLVA